MDLSSDTKMDSRFYSRDLSLSMSSWSVRKRFLIFLIPVALLFAWIIYLLYDARIKNSIIVFQTTELNTVDYTKRTINTAFGSVIEDMRFLSYRSRTFLEQGDDRENSGKSLKDDLVEFCRIKEDYGSITITDTTGREVLKIQCSSDKTTLTPTDRLVSIGKTEHFQQIITMKQGEIYLSSENGEFRISDSFREKFLIHFGMPLFGQEGQRTGTLILEYYPRNILDIIKQSSPGYGNFYIVTPEGKAALMITEEKTGSHDRYNWEIITSESSESWQHIQSIKTGQFRTPEGLFTFTTVEPMAGFSKSIPGGRPSDTSEGQTHQAYSWKIVSFIPERILKEDTRDIFNQFILLYAIILIIPASVSWFLARSQILRNTAENRIRHLNRVLEAIFNVEQIIVQETNQELLCERICQSLIHTQSYSSAFIVLLDPNREFLLAKQAGIGDDFFILEEHFRAGKYPYCLRSFIESQETCAIYTPVIDCLTCPLRGIPGYHSRMLASLQHGNKQFGYLVVSVSENVLQDTEEVKIFQEVAKDIAFALHGIEASKEQRQAEEALKESEERMRTLIESTPDFVLFKDESGRWLIANEAYLRLYRLDSVDYRGKTTEELRKYASWHKNALEKSKELDEEAWNNSGPLRVEETVHHLDRKDSVYDVIRVPLFHPDGKRKGLVILGRDISDRKEAEKELFRKNRELNDFTYMVSHDLKNPIYIIKGFLKAIHDNPTLFTDYYGRVMNQTEYLIKFIDELLLLSRAGRVIDEKHQIDVEQLLRRLFIFMRPENSKDSLIISDTPLPPITGDPARIEQVFMNILSNAFQYRDPDKEALIIEVLYTCEGEFTVYRIRDNGIGIKRENLSKVFEAGFSMTKGAGSGFGLAIARKIINAHGGSIGVYSEGEGLGTEFAIRLPGTSCVGYP